MSGMPTTVTVNGRAIRYASVVEAQDQAARWVAESIRFATEAADYTIVWGGTTWHVLGQADRTKLVVQSRRGQRGRCWTGAEMRAAVAERFPHLTLSRTR